MGLLIDTRNNFTIRDYLGARSIYIYLSMDRFDNNNGPEKRFPLLYISYCLRSLTTRTKIKELTSVETGFYFNHFIKINMLTCKATTSKAVKRQLQYRSSPDVRSTKGHFFHSSAGHNSDDDHYDFGK